MILNPAFDYDRKDHNYAAIRRADPRIGQYVADALRDARTVLNVGAGTGSYEPEDKYVVAVEPSSVMRAKRLAGGKHPAIDAKADSLPFDDKSFDAAMMVLTIHHWPDLKKGLQEVKRVTRDKIVILTYDPEQLDVFWNTHYFPELIEVERRRYPPLSRIGEHLECPIHISKIAIPLDCSDGFQEAFYGRPEAFLDRDVRNAQSAWGFLDEATHAECVERLRADLASGRWDELYGAHRTMARFVGAYRVVEIALR
jgi:SAM-dependent methyltransferase